MKLQDCYAVVKTADMKKPVLVQLQEKNKNLTGIVQNEFARTKPDVVPLTDEDILSIHLGKSPPLGQSYKVKIEPLTKTIKLENWGNIHLFRYMTKVERSNLLDGLRYSYKKFHIKFKLKYLLPLKVEVRPNYGKTQGYYKQRKNKSEEDSDFDDTLTLCPETFVQLTKEAMLRLVAHEFGHPLWSQYLSKKAQARWIKMYHHYLTIEQLNLEELKNSYEDFKNNGELPSVYIKSLEEKPKAIFKAVLDFINKNHKLKVKDLDVLHEAGELLQNFWPTTKLHLSDMKPVITEYGKKNPVEFFCEAVSFYATSQELPPRITKLVKKTLKSVRAK